MDYIKELERDFPNAMSNVYCGAYIGKGWIPAVREALAVLEAAGAKVAQIKEKFGGLRLYWDSPDLEVGARPFSVWHYIACSMAEKQAEAKCWKICEDCGQPGVIRNSGWIRTLCDSCAIPKGKKKVNGTTEAATGNQNSSSETKAEE